VLNLDQGPFTRVATELGTLEIAQAALEADLLINLPKLKRHSLTRVTLGIKNLMGLLSRDSRRWLHVRGLERGLVALAQTVNPQLTILDALTVTSRAVYGESAPLGMVLGSRDLVALDCYACGLLGEDPQQIAHIREAIRRGLGGSDYQVVGLSETSKVARSFTSQTLEVPTKRLYRLFFRAMYLADLPVSRLTGRSLIPYVHYWLGIRPHLEKGQCDRCGRCATVCPVGAIQVEEKRIIPARCMRVRCLRCVSACPRGAIRVRGWRVGAR
jgi:ferredoxin